MKIVSYKCGCVKIADTIIFLHYCEGDTDEYGFYMNKDRKCEGEAIPMNDNDAHVFLWNIAALVSDGHRYRELRNMMNRLLTGK